MRIGFDLDGVVYDFQGALKEILATEFDFPPAEMPPATHWHFYKDWDMTADEFVYFITQSTERYGLFDYADPINDADNVIRTLHNAGHSIHIVTDRDWGRMGEAQAQTVAWLKGHSIPYDSLTFTATKEIVKVDYHIDDKPSNVTAMDASGAQGYLLSRPWNWECVTVNRLADLWQYLEIIDPSLWKEVA